MSTPAATHHDLPASTSSNTTSKDHGAKPKPQPVHESLFVMPDAPSLTMIVNHTITANSVMTATELASIAHEFNNHYHHADKSSYYVAFALACADQGSSAAGIIAGSYNGVDFTHFAHVIKKYTTVRKFNMYFAKVIWNVMINNSRPPANWQRKGFTSSTRYAAFDFFNGVQHAAAFEPPTGLIRAPSLEEIQAAAANAAILIQQSRITNPHSTLGMPTLANQNTTNLKTPQLGYY